MASKDKPLITTGTKMTEAEFLAAAEWRRVWSVDAVWPFVDDDARAGRGPVRG